MLTQERLKELLFYDPDTGVFTRKKWQGGTGFAGAPAGGIRKDGYVCISVDNKRYLAHRLVWLYVNGYLPPDEIDHINRKRNDNRLCNLRLAKSSENRQNMSKPRNNKSGVVGVIWHKAACKWMAYIHINNGSVYLGLYDTVKEASEARARAKREYHKFVSGDKDVSLTKEETHSRDHEG